MVPGDLVIADDTGVCFVPNEAATAVIERILVVSRLEAHELALQDVDQPKRD